MSAQNIFNKLKAAIGNDFGVCGLMGNLKAESNMSSTNLQNTYEKKFGMTDAEYTQAVDNGSYTNFVNDSAGYGLAQWTYWSRKQALLEFAKSVNKSIGDEDMQIDFMIKELKGYKTVWSVLTSATSVREASDIVLTQYERPADQSESVKIKRASYGDAFYEEFCIIKGKEETKVGFTNSPLVTYKRITEHKTVNRKYDITRITPHCIVGQWTAKQGCDYFATTDRECSANYIVGKDGSVGLSVEEKDRSWCSSSSDNDNRAITIECASDVSAPYAFTDACYNKLVELCVDICKRNGKTKLLWFGDKDKSLNYKPAANEMVLTVHRWFAAKSCPGDWMYARMGDLATKVTAQLNHVDETKKEDTGKEDKIVYRVQVGAYSKKENAEAMVKKLKAAGFDAIIKTEGEATVEVKEEVWVPKVGDIVNFNGGKHYVSANASSGDNCPAGEAKITQIYQLGKSKHPYHLVRTGKTGPYGWVDENSFTKK